MAESKRARMAEKVKEKKLERLGEKGAVMEELDIDDLKDLTGGSIHNVNFTNTHDISDDTKKNI